MWHYLEPPGKQIDINSTLGEIFSGNQGQSRQTPQIAPLHLFGLSSQKSAPIKKAEPVAAPVTKLNLKLNGVFASTPAENSLAIISTNARDEQLYAIDENLPGGAILKEVYADRVIIERSGQLETLLLPKEDLKNRGILRYLRSMSRFTSLKS